MKPVVLIILSVATLLLALICGATFPAEAALTDGWRTPIIAFELARGPADLAFLAGPDAEPLRAAMDLGHRYDALFPLAYGGLLVASARSLDVRLWARVGMVAGAAAIGLDWWENHTLVGLTDALRDGTSVEAGLSILQKVTWLKWGAIALSVGCVGMAEKRERRFQLLVHGLVAGLVLAAWLVPVFVPGLAGPLGEAMALGIVVGFVTLVVRAVRLRRKASA